MSTRCQCAYINVLQGCNGPVGVFQLWAQVGHTIKQVLPFTAQALGLQMQKIRDNMHESQTTCFIFLLFRSEFINLQFSHRYVQVLPQQVIGLLGPSMCLQKASKQEGKYVIHLFSALIELIQNP